MASQQMNEIEELIKGLRKVPRFKSYLILNNDGIVIKWDQEGKPMPYSKAVQYAHHVMDVFSKSRMCIKELFDDSYMESIRIRSDAYELIASQEGHYTLVVIQDGDWDDKKVTNSEETAENTA